MIAPKHILGTFDEALASLRDNVLMMSSLTERSLDRAMKGLFDRNDNLCANAIADDEVILAVVTGDSRRDNRLGFLSVGTWSSQALVRSQEGCLAHAVLPNQSVNSECRQAGGSESGMPPDHAQCGLIFSGKVPR